MQIHFQNSYPSRVYVAIAIYNSSCQPPWDSQGWWAIDTGGSAYVANTCNRYLYFYAEAVNGAYWGGPFEFEVAESAFDFCPTAEIGFSGATAGMREIDDNIGGICWPWDSYTLELIP